MSSQAAGLDLYWSPAQRSRLTPQFCAAFSSMASLVSLEIAYHPNPYEINGIVAFQQASLTVMCKPAEFRKNALMAGGQSQKSSA